MSGQAEKDRAGRLLAALERGTDGLTDAELAALREDLAGLSEGAEADASGRDAERRAALQEVHEHEREAERVRRREARRTAREKLPGGWRWAEYEWTRCGNKNHVPCRSGEYPHGPYWFVYSRPDGGSGSPKKRYIGRRLDEEAATALTELQMRQEAKVGRSKRAAEIRAGMRDDEIGLDGAGEVEDLLPERPGWRQIVSERAAELLGLTPEEAYPDEFTEEEREKAAKTPSREEQARRTAKRREAARERAEAQETEEVEAATAP